MLYKLFRNVSFAVIFAIGLGEGARGSIAINQNLIQNPGAEASPGVTDVTNGAGLVAAPADWVTSSSFTAVSYAATGGDVGPAFSRLINGGKNYFQGGPNNALSTATQDIDVSGDAAAIDAGGVACGLGGWLGGFSSQEDNMVVTAEFLSGTGAQMGQVLNIGPVTAEDRGDVSEMQLRASAGLVPPGTRTVEITMTATRFTGSYNDGLADNVDFQLLGAPRGYWGLVRTGTATNDWLVNVTPLKSGSVAVALKGVGGTYKARGTGSTLTVPVRGGTPITVNIQNAPDGYAVSATEGSVSGSGTLEPTVGYTNAIPASQAGRYTLELEATGTAANTPQGTGYAIMNVTKTGVVSMVGRVPDYKAFTTAPVLVTGTEGSGFVVYVPLTYGATSTAHAPGVLIGTIAFTGTAGPGLSGTLEWVKPAQTSGLFQGALDTELQVVGVPYTAPKSGQSVLPGFVNGSVQFMDDDQLAMSGTGGTPLLTVTVTLTPPNQFAATSTTGTNGFKLAVTPGSGVFSGRFTYPGESSTRLFQGVLLQSGTDGVGFYLGPKGSGAVLLQP